METIRVNARFRQFYGLDRIIGAFRVMTGTEGWQIREATPMIDRRSTAFVRRYDENGEGYEAIWQSKQERVRLIYAQGVAEEFFVNVEFEPVPFEEKRLPNILRDRIPLVACSFSPFCASEHRHERSILEDTFQRFTFGFIRTLEKRL